jgi:ABC-type transporter Mla subunit MlaD
MARLEGAWSLVKKAVEKAVQNSSDRLPALKSELAKTTAHLRKVKDQANGLMQGFNGTAAQANGFVIERLNALDLERKIIQEQEAKLNMDIDAQKDKAIDPEAARKGLMAFNQLYEHLQPEEKQQLFRLAIKEIRYDGLGQKISLSLHPMNLDEGLGGTVGVSTVQFGSLTWMIFEPFSSEFQESIDQNHSAKL